MVKNKRTCSRNRGKAGKDSDNRMILWIYFNCINDMRVRYDNECRLGWMMNDLKLEILVALIADN